jgi:glucose/arabinose dehydrogenase
VARPAQAPAASPAAQLAASRGLVPAPISVPASLRQGVFGEDRQVQLREGFSIGVFARLERARSLALAPWGELLVTQPNAGRVMALRASGDPAVAEAPRVLADGLECPYGMAFHDGHLYVAQSTRVSRFPFDASGAVGQPEVVVSGLPSSPCGPHHFRPLAIDASGNLFIAFGSSCNVCVEPDPRRGTVWQYGPDGNGREYARGLRNVVDLAIHPQTGQLWGVTNERDQLGDDVPPEPIGPIQQGAEYGWPSCYWNGSDWAADRRVPGRPGGCEGLTQYFGIQAHSAPLGLDFGTSANLPADYRTSAFVGLHGSWNRSQGTGFKVIRVQTANGQPVGVEDFVAGWLTGPRGPSDAWGRPVDVQVGADGALYLSDDVAGAVYRISYRGT